MKQDPPLDAKCRDKFLVQSVPITGDTEVVSVQEIVGLPQASDRDWRLTIPLCSGTR